MQTVLNLSLFSLFLMGLLNPTNLFARPLPDKMYMNEVEKDWEFIYEKSGIKVYERKKNLDDSPMAFRALGIINASTMKVLCLLRHVESSSNWTPNLKVKKTIIEYDFLDAVIYNVNKLPWPASDRDTILHSKLTVDKSNNSILVQTWSEEHPDYPPFKDIVRGILYHSNFIFKPTADGKTFVDIDAHFDPKGLIPKWLVNFVQKDWVYHFLVNLEKEARTTKLPAREEFKKIIDEVTNLDQKEVSNVQQNEKKK